MRIRKPPPEETPDYRWQSFQEKHPPPAHCLNKIARADRHPQQRHRATEDQKRVSSRTFSARKPIAHVDQHCGKNRRLCHTESETKKQQSRSVANNTGQGGKASPKKQAKKDEFSYTLPLRVDRPGNLENTVSKSKQRSNQSGHLPRKVEIGSHARCRGNTIICSIEIRQAVGDKHQR